MNWYKQIKLSQMPGSYIEIGHSSYYDPNSECEEWLWIYDNGKILTEKATYQVSHGETWALGNAWFGRYDDCSKRISIAEPPSTSEYEQIPSVLVKALERTFPNATEIYAFTRSGIEMV